MQMIIDWLNALEWQRVIPELIGKALGIITGFAVSWFLLFRRRLNALQKLQAGDSDDFVFQMHCLYPFSDSSIDPESESGSLGDKVVLLFRNVAPKATLNDLYDNIAVREALKALADKTSLSDPILKTEGTMGFEMLNDALGHIGGTLANSPFERETWLFAMTCEDRQFVRKKCIRCFLIRPQDLELFRDWKWCRNNVLVEKPWHWFRIVALHRIACVFQQEKELTLADANNNQDTNMPLVDRQLRHDRVRAISIGLSSSEKPVSQPHRIAWETHLPSLKELGLT